MRRACRRRRRRRRVPRSAVAPWNRGFLASVVSKLSMVGSSGSAPLARSRLGTGRGASVDAAVPAVDMERSGEAVMGVRQAGCGESGWRLSHTDSRPVLVKSSVSVDLSYRFRRGATAVFEPRRSHCPTLRRPPRVGKHLRSSRLGTTGRQLDVRLDQGAGSRSWIK